MEKVKSYVKGNKLVVELVAALVVLIVIAGGFYLYLVLRPLPASNNNDKNPAGGQTAKDETCGELVATGATEGTSPLKVLLKGKINGSVDNNKPVCQWSLDRAPLLNSYPVNGYCVFGKDPIVTKGEHEVSYKLDGKTCSASKKVIVR